MGRPRKDDLKLPAAPFAAWLKAHLPADTNINAWEEMLGLAVSGLRHYTSGRRQTVRLSFADRVLTESGAHLRDVYPDLYDFEESA